MPRRPRKQPFASKSSGGKEKISKRVKPSDGKIKKWATRDDIVGDEEDDFHHKRDQILLDGEGDDGDDDWGDGEEEVFGLDLDDGSSDEEAYEGPERKDEDEDEDILIASKAEKEKKHKKSKKKKDASPPPSDAESESDEYESWGKKKSAYYSSNAGILSMKEGQEDEEEANDMEEQEAKRLQAKMRDGMSDGDFGLDDVMDLVADEIMREGTAQVVTEATPADVPLDTESAIRCLEKTSPETLALAREWDDVVHDLMKVQQRMDKQMTTSPEDLSFIGLTHLHHQTLLTYVTTLAFYLHLRSAPLPLSPQQTSRLKAVLDRLLILKQGLSTMEDLDFDASSDEEDDEDLEESDISSLDEEEKAEMLALFSQDPDAFGPRTVRLSKKNAMADLDAMLQAADQAAAQKSKKTKTKDVKVSEKKTKKKTKETSQSQFDLVEPQFVPVKHSGHVEDDSAEAFGESTSLSAADDADKKSRKKSLRFHTSRIETSVRRKEEAREKMGGDDDIPYRERNREKEARIRREVAKARGTGGDDLDYADPEAESSSVKPGKRKRDAEDSASGEEDDNGYYELVKRVKKEKREDKKQAYEQARQEERTARVFNESAEGPRSLTRAILKNKGLTPHRSKSVRNPRVKKREKYEQAKKKVRSQKAVYKGGLAGKPYGGEQSGITKVVKSVKLV